MTAALAGDADVEIGHVLFMDVVGFSKLLVDEQTECSHRLNQIVRNTDQFRTAEAVDKLIRLPTGDGMVLVFFTSPEAPVRCAVEIARALRGSSDLGLRMGIHSGPVNKVIDVNDRSNLAGGGINMAQRVMDCGDAGHILLSKRVAEDLAQYGRWQPHLHELGAFEVKHGVRLEVVNLYTEEYGNAELPEKLDRARQEHEAADVAAAQEAQRVASLAARPLDSVPGDARKGPWWRGPRLAVIVGLLVLGVGATWMAYRPQPSVAMPLGPPRIAVLPFENLGGPNEEPFAAGITDEITSRLVEISALRVVSRTSAKRFKGRAVSIADVGKALNADYILEGTVRTDRAANGAGTARVTPQLIRVSDDVHVWQHRFDASLTPGDIFGVQAAIATQVAAAMNVTILEPEKRRVARAVTNDSAAYRLYQLGRFQWEKRTPESLARAQEYFREAIKRDPNFARAYAGLGDASFIYARTVTPDSGRVKSAAAISALRRAVALDSTLAEGYAGLGYALAIGTWDRAAADSAFRRAIALDPNYAPAHYWYAQLLWLTGAPSTTLEEAREAVNLDPLSAVAHVVLGLTYRRAARYGEALAEFQRSFELQPTYVLPQLWLCLEYGRLGQAKAAEDAARQFVSGLPHERIDEEAVREFARVAAGRGDAIKLVRLLDAGGVDLGHSTIAILFAQARMPDSAFARMQRAIDVGNAVVVQGLAYLEPLLGHDPRWPALVRRAGFVSR